MVFVSPLLTCGKAYPWICDKLTLIKRGWEKIHQPENWKIWEKMVMDTSSPLIIPGNQITVSLRKKWNYSQHNSVGDIIGKKSLLFQHFPIIATAQNRQSEGFLTKKYQPLDVPEALLSSTARCASSGFPAHFQVPWSWATEPTEPTELRVLRLQQTLLQGRGSVSFGIHLGVSKNGVPSGKLT